MLCDGTGADAHTESTIDAVAHQLGLTEYVDADIAHRAPDACRVRELRRLYGLVRVLPRLTLLCTGPVALTHGQCLASWLLGEWDSDLLRQLRLPVQARTAHVQPPLGQGAWLHGEQLEVCPSDGELVGVHLQARYMQAQEGGHLVELLAYPDEPPRLFASSLL